VRTPRIFTDQALAEGEEVVLDENAARHLVSVLRFSPGDGLILFNGAGGEYRAQLLTTASKKASALVGQFSTGLAPSPLVITLAVGLSRGDRMDWLIQKAVELGVTSILPLFTERSEVKLKPERAAKKTRHWQEVARSACEQSGQNMIPTVSLPITFAQALQSPAAWRLILDPCANSDLLSEMASYSSTASNTPPTSSAESSTKPEPPESVLILSGPEGGFSDDELGLARDKTITPVGLGPRILRTETAPLAALSVLQAQWGDWR
jgi:16S rRNA (uracil1498-N3)-methyltransferase